ncbi:response regulator [Mesorhizobium sp. BAC0120]|uniref:response regulator n=1 Tax=Mesorhizobium sp. BAC0120 TaxID=3090670 RepID=UPI00298C3EED|nr:response regulator [Mesorhizobium sp. BAC0120]MDW6021693.1 response regulator [Mesorhizobium sp. BAC0120]
MSADALRDLRILLLEDDFLIAMHVESLCRDYGAAEVVVRHGLDEVDEKMVADFDVAIIDVLLSGVSALPLAEQLAKSGRPFVLASAYVEVEEVKKDFPGVPVIGKPFAGDDLVAAVATAAGRT